MATELNTVVTYVCPDRDIECGNRVDRWCDECPKRSRSPAANKAEVTGDTALVDYIAANAVRGATYHGITSINVIVHVEDLQFGVRHAINRMCERAAASLKCWACEADRSKEHCKMTYDVCPFLGEAHGSTEGVK